MAAFSHIKCHQVLHVEEKRSAAGLWQEWLFSGQENITFSTVCPAWPGYHRRKSWKIRGLLPTNALESTIRHSSWRHQIQNLTLCVEGSSCPVVLTKQNQAPKESNISFRTKMKKIKKSTERMAGCYSPAPLKFLPICTEWWWGLGNASSLFAHKALWSVLPLTSNTSDTLIYRELRYIKGKLIKKNNFQNQVIDEELSFSLNICL